MNFQPKNLLKGMVAAAAAVVMVGAAQAADISGAGATFPYPIYAKWAEAYKAKTGVGLNYQSIGSGGGIKQIKAKTVTFGASDMPLKAEELKEAGLQQFPMIMGGVVPVVNVKGIAPGQIQLDGPTIAKIYLGQIASWDDPAIKAQNPGLNLPKTSIVPVYRSDGSGTNFLWTTYLSKEDKEFAERVGANTSVQWAAGLGAKGNEGVANMVKLTDGAIGYVEYAYAKQNTLTYTKLKNHDGKVVSPEIKAFQAAAAGADWANAPGFYLVLVDQPGADSWPITGASFILVYSQPQDGAAVAEALKFFDWAYNNGQAAAEQLDYVPMPAAVVAQVEKSWSTVKTADGKPVWSK
ncbi:MULTISPECIES: phosphate ABC transporter substrate-binding protein PstS [Nitrospirillum]|uniref:Phosphate-binding protein PstS n=1 Tax=Nitrospirillum amazonense TaxID=28077 RepID=A0A560J0V1_9PROT|nr:phosphate ABC transporter substrate-binding protein PstS [Nitrospirillum amazonense]MEC4593519.1 phosphate ABC transporter substrate-binding protein PstS [Nitrospirillum amazonense]TWB17028.1 phosphate ABC transporter substrate-binding protein (PhoT family) [Nitrospirillum amazonense]TWB62270.1 phosphate ABC transporter substrate-binding protein (PhoT family) [Nitrospirillum amazonense]